MTSTRKVGVNTQSNPTPDCCMCGDQGITDELFNCKFCLFRYQHRYCSNLYPEADCYNVCNWCLHEETDSAEKTQFSSTSSKQNSDESNDQAKMKIKKKCVQSQGKDVKGQKDTWSSQGSKDMRNNSPPERSVNGPRKVDSSGGLKNGLRRTQSENILKNRGKQVNRSRVRKYKLLEEVVCSQ